MIKYLAFDIGCIECGESSAVVGVFETKELALKAAEEAEDKQKESWQGQHSMEVFEIEV